MRLEDGPEARLVFELNCKLGIKKIYRLTYEESEALQAVYSHDTPNLLVSRPRMLLDAANNFHNSLDEITLITQKGQVKLKSFMEDARSTIP